MLWPISCRRVTSPPPPAHLLHTAQQCVCVCGRRQAVEVETMQSTKSATRSTTIILSHNSLSPPHPLSQQTKLHALQRQQQEPQPPLLCYAMASNEHVPPTSNFHLPHSPPTAFLASLFRRCRCRCRCAASAAAALTTVNSSNCVYVVCVR